MRDFNFFSQIAQERKSSSNRKNIGGSILGLVVFVFVVSFSVNMIRMHMIKKSINNYEAKINAPSMKEKVSEATKIEKEHNTLEKYYNNVKVAAEEIYSNDYVNTQRIKIINSTVPNDVIFTQINIDNKTVTIQALSKTRSAISDLQYNLNNLGFIDNTYISGISERNAQGEYSFSVSCTLKEVGNNENKQ